MGPEHAGSSWPSRTAGLPKTRLVQPELYEFYFPKLWNSHDPRISREAALYSMASGASSVGQTNLSPYRKASRERRYASWRSVAGLDTVTST